MIKACVRANKIQLRFDYDQQIIDEVKSTGCAEWRGVGKYWVLVPNIEALEFVLGRDDVRLDEKDIPKIDKFIADIERKERESIKKKKLCRALTAMPVPSVLPYVKVPSVYGCQWVPLHYALAQEKVGFILADEQGVGKTMETTLITLHERFNSQPVLIVCPANCVGNWVDELDYLFGIKAKIITDYDFYEPDTRYYIISYNRLSKFVTRQKGKKTQIATVFKEQKWFMLVDESLFVKNPKTQRHKNVAAIRKYQDHIILMTGTPMGNNAMELYGQLKIVDPNFMTWTKFGETFCGLEWGFYGREFTGKPDNKALNEMLDAHYMIRRTKKDVYKDLPPKIRQAINLGGKKLKSYSNVLELFSQNARIKSQDKEFLEWIELQIETQIDNGGKVLVVGHFKDLLDAMGKIFEKRGWKYLRIDGSVAAGEARQKRVRAFQKDPEIKGMILSITAAGMGLTLTAADLTIFPEMYWEPASIWQAEDRNHRPGQKNPTLCLYPLNTDFDHYLYHKVVTKIGLFTQIIEGELLDLEDDGSLLKEISKDWGVPIK